MRFESLYIADDERMLLANDESFLAILHPGKYVFMSLQRIDVERHNIRNVTFRSKWADYLAAERPDVVDKHFVKVETAETEVAIVYADSGLHEVMPPAKRQLFWRDAAVISAEVVKVIEVAHATRRCMQVKNSETFKAKGRSLQSSSIRIRGPCA